MAEQAKKIHKMPLLYLMAALAFFTLLGISGLWLSEDRWAEVTREMLLTGDWFHPACNGEIYFDKPLLSYWLILPFMAMMKWAPELACRIPSAAAALIAVIVTVKFGERLWNRKTGIAAGWLLFSCMGVLIWGRAAAADMGNMCAVVLAVVWFYVRKDKPGFVSYLVFWLICFAGAQLKGLPALIIPLVVMFPYMIKDKRFVKHIRISNFVSLAIGGVVFLLPFLIASRVQIPEMYQAPGHNLSGLELVWRENILRAFDSFDHNDEPFFCYLYHIPRILLPWSPLFLLGLVAAIKNRKQLDENSRWMLWAMLLILLMFSASESRRWYYILPIAPFCALFTARFLESQWEERWRDIACRLYRYAGLIAAWFGVAAILAIPGFFIVAKICKWDMSFPLLLVSFPVIGIITLLLDRRINTGKELVSSLPLELNRRYAGAIIPVALVFSMFFAFSLPLLDQYRTEKPFILSLRPVLADIPLENIAFYAQPNPKVVFYLETAEPIRTLALDKKLLRENPEQAAEKLREETWQFINAPGRRALISYSRSGYMRELNELIPNREPQFREPFYPFERKKSRKLYVWILNNNDNNANDNKQP